MKESVKRATILTPPEVRQLARVHRQIGALLASNGVPQDSSRRERARPTNTPSKLHSLKSRNRRKRKPRDR